MILGHNHTHVVEAVQAQVKRAFSFGTPTALEVAMAKLIKSMGPNIDMVRMVNSGTEACMSALPVARGFTGKSKIIKLKCIPRPSDYPARISNAKRTVVPSLGSRLAMSDL